MVVRHGETEWSRDRRHTGRTDVPLTPEGERAARALARVFAGRRFGLALTSPLTRARRTAELAGITATPEPDLVEWDYGGYEGMTTEEIAAATGHDWWIWADGVVPGPDSPGETVDQVAVRVRRVLDRARPVLAAGEDVVLVAHGHSLRILTACWLGLAPAAGALFVLAAGSWGALGFEHGRPALVAWNTGE